MAKVRLSNDTDGILALWTEPLGEDRWMKPGEQFTVVAGDSEPAPADDVPFDVAFHDQGISVWVNVGYEAVVYDQSGAELDCGHQRPLEVLRSWTESAEAAATRAETRPDFSPSLRESIRKTASDMRDQLTTAEAESS
ncbi:hypothetical protein [Streptomyces sp. R35]|uniref:Uncharacterized protein n=1 Tax=Streptomyces sp. R35 TaxID=3238630 RepID=A0AB39SA31_9ACTN